VLLVNSIGFLLKYFSLDRYFIVLGFRFHLALVFPFIYLFLKRRTDYIKLELKKFEFKSFLNHFILVIIPAGVLVTVPFIMKIIDLADPDYFYEFGLSSVFDFPVYFVWNLPQILMISIFVKFVCDHYKPKFLLCLLILLFLPAYEFIPLQKVKFSIFPVIDLLSAVILIALISTNAKNIYAIAISIFTIFWSNVLLFGSKEESFIRILFAKNFDSWEGFFEVPKFLINYSFVIQEGFTFLFFMIYYIFVRNKKAS
jgi:hypothetical protein